MKVKHAQDNVQGSSGLAQTSAYTITANAHAFKVLSSGLYSDKVRAVLREIGCNAADAHIEAGIADRPFHVKLPNALDDQFFVKDWGPGMTHDEVMKLYTSYFESTKQRTNDQTGAFGLGSKSPFSYVDSYTVVSVSGGRKRTYALYLDNHGLPTISLMAEEDPDPDWESGVLVSFAVRPSDYQEFLDKSQEVFQWFRTLPRVTGARAKFEPIEKLRECDDFIVTQKGHSACVVMGNVRYPIDWSKLAANTGPQDAIDMMRPSQNIVLKAGIGDLDVVVSREHLEYTKHTIKNLRAIAKRTVEKLGAELCEAALEAKREGWAALCQVEDSVQIIDHVGWKSPLIKRIAQIAGYTEAEGTFVYLVTHESSTPMPQCAGRKCSVTLVQKNSAYKNGVRLLHITDGGVGSFNYRPNVTYAEKSVIVRGESVKHIQAKLRGAVASGLYDQVICVTNSKTMRANLHDIVIEAAQISEALYDMPVVDLDTLPMPAGFVPSKRGKGFVRHGGLPDVMVNTCTVVNWRGDEVGVKLLDLAPTDRVFIAKQVKSAWGRMSTRYRWMKPGATADNDNRMREHEWLSSWRTYSKLVNKLDLRSLPQQVVICSPSEVAQWKLRANGFKSFPEAMQELGQSQAVRDAVRTVSKGIYPSVPQTRWRLDDHGWVTALGCLIVDKDLPDEYREVLERYGALDAAQKLADAGDAGHQIESLLNDYQELCRRFNVQPQSLQMDDPLTIADLDARFKARFPRGEMFRYEQIAHLLSKDRAGSRSRVVEFLEWILTEDNEA